MPIQALIPCEESQVNEQESNRPGIVSQAEQVAPSLSNERAGPGSSQSRCVLTAITSC